MAAMDRETRSSERAQNTTLTAPDYRKGKSSRAATAMTSDALCPLGDTFPERRTTIAFLFPFLTFGLLETISEGMTFLSEAYDRMRMASSSEDFEMITIELLFLIYFGNLSFSLIGEPVLRLVQLIHLHLVIWIL